MTKSLRKAIMLRSSLKNKLYKNFTDENNKIYKKQKNYCSRLYKKERKKFYEKLNVNDINDNKIFWKTVKPFLSEKGTIKAKITLVESGEIISEDEQISEILNSFFAGSVQSLDIQENRYITNPTDGLTDPINIALKKFESHPSILKIKKKISTSVFSFTPVSLENVNDAIESLDPKKANTYQNIPVKNLKENIDVTSVILHRIFNEAILNCKFPDKLKLADISPHYKTDDATDKKNYRPISILPPVSKLLEKLLHTQIAYFIENHLYKYMCGYRKGYSTQHALVVMLEKWKTILDKQGYAGGIIMDLSKAFDTINHELLLAKLHAYGFDKTSLSLIWNYLTNRWHRTKINMSFSSWEELLHGVPQGSVLGPLLFNIYFNDLFFIVEKTDATNYADDTTLYACDNDLSSLIRRLEHDALISIEWFESNYMKLNQGKCHFLISGTKYEQLWVKVGQNQIWESPTEKILGINIDANLKFDSHVKFILNNAGRKLSALSRMSKVLSFSKLRILIKLFFDSQFAYCPLVWMFQNRNLNNRINKLQERALRILYKDDITTSADLLDKDQLVTIHNRNIQLLAIEMYKVKNSILPCALSDFVSIKENIHNIRIQSNFLRKR